jgi:hypothetical protein
MKKSAACLMSGTVMPVWSWPRNPGTPSARAAVAPASAAAAMAKQRAYRRRVLLLVGTGMGDRAGLPEILGAMVVRA